MEAIVDLGGRFELLVTLKDNQQPNKSGRVWLDEFATSHATDLVKVRNVNDPAVIDAIRQRDLDWLFIIGWSQIAGPHILKAPRHGVLGMHPTLLPEGRGRAAIPWAILLGLTETGVTLFKLDEGVDTGPIVAQHRLQLAARETATELYGRVERAHRELIAECWPLLVADAIRPVAQDESRASFWPGRCPADGRLDLRMSVDEADRLIRATTRPYPGAFIENDDGSRVVIWHATLGETPGTATRRLEFSDGVLSAIEWEIVSLGGD